ncbi:HAMP domain protein [Roseovarius gaetbuli]|uniref:HAMP domain protein n=1 Tax=Roseovarius gaetbuli TaxID=1356575 RepID=A0A1X6YFR8_9RHOB|nr:HAMP domain protein [Roseovarius gaetbuli]
MAANAVVTPQLGRPFGLYVVTEMPRDALFAAANKMLVRNAVVAFVLIFLAIGIAGIIGAHLSDPLRQLADAVRRHVDDEPFDLRVSSDDEIGELTLAFASLGN